MELIYLCHPIKKAVGGVKVIYRQAELVNKILNDSGHFATVMHPNTWFFKVRWFSSEVKIKRGFFKWRWFGKISRSKIDGFFDSKSQIVVLPELWARKYGDQLIRLNIPFVIFVQNGYYITKGDPDILNIAYRGARCILTISDDASRCVKMAFPGNEDKILRIHYSVNSGIFNSNKIKENIISFMPRKLPGHSSKVIFFLRNHLPSNWKILPVSGLDEDGVAEILARSKIFMSFSDFEGCPLPPLEAAMAGNQVIGYTGQGAKEYWMPEIFEEIESGDVVTFAQKVLDKVKSIESRSIFPIYTDSIKKLSEIYSVIQEKNDLEKFIKKLGI